MGSYKKKDMSATVDVMPCLIDLLTYESIHNFSHNDPSLRRELKTIKLHDGVS